MSTISDRPPTEGQPGAQDPSLGGPQGQPGEVPTKDKDIQGADRERALAHAGLTPTGAASLLPAPPTNWTRSASGANRRSSINQ